MKIIEEQKTEQVNNASVPKPALSDIEYKNYGIVPAKTVSYNEFLNIALSSCTEEKQIFILMPNTSLNKEIVQKTFLDKILSASNKRVKKEFKEWLASNTDKIECERVYIPLMQMYGRINSYNVLTKKIEYPLKAELKDLYNYNDVKKSDLLTDDKNDIKVLCNAEEYKRLLTNAINGTKSHINTTANTKGWVNINWNWIYPEVFLQPVWVVKFIYEDVEFVSAISDHATSKSIISCPIIKRTQDELDVTNKKTLSIFSAILNGMLFLKLLFNNYTIAELLMYGVIGVSLIISIFVLSLESGTKEQIDDLDKDYDNIIDKRRKLRKTSSGLTLLSLIILVIVWVIGLSI